MPSGATDSTSAGGRPSAYYNQANLDSKLHRHCYEKARGGLNRRGAGCSSGMTNADQSALSTDDQTCTSDAESGTSNDDTIRFVISIPPSGWPVRLSFQSHEEMSRFIHRRDGTRWPWPSTKDSAVSATSTTMTLPVGWLTVQEAAPLLRLTASALLKRLGRAARRAKEGVVAKLDGVEGRQLGRSWRVSIPAGWKG